MTRKVSNWRASLVKSLPWSAAKLNIVYSSHAQGTKALVLVVSGTQPDWLAKFGLPLNSLG